MATPEKNEAAEPPGALPTAAQIPLESFELPEFPAQAQQLKALTLTCDAPLDVYTNSLTKDYKVSNLPSEIESLTLELFALGYPAGFLKEVAQKLPRLSSLTIFGQLLGGVTSESNEDAANFFGIVGPRLRELHLIDTFAQPGLVNSIGSLLQRDRAPDKDLMFLEVSYTVRHAEDFLARISGAELPSLISKGLITLALNMAPSEGAEEEVWEKEKGEADGKEKNGDRRSKQKDGITPLNRTLATDLVAKLTEEETRPKDLKMLNATLYSISMSQLRAIKLVHSGLLMLSVTVDIETESSDEGDEEWVKWKKGIMDSLGWCGDLEQVEIVGNPGLQFALAVGALLVRTRSELTLVQVQNPQRKVFDKVWPNKEDMDFLKSKCPNLTKFHGNILRKPGGLEWKFENGEWHRGVLTKE